MLNKNYQKALLRKYGAPNTTIFDFDALIFDFWFAIIYFWFRFFDLKKFNEFIISIIKINYYNLTLLLLVNDAMADNTGVLQLIGEFKRLVNMVQLYFSGSSLEDK